MKEVTVHIRKKADPVLIDKVIQDLQDTLSNKLSWLDKAFGRAYKLVEHRPDGNKTVYPAFYNGKAEYVSLLPNDNFGNFCWFDIYDSQKVTQVVQALPQLTFQGAIVFWFDLSTIYEDADVLYTEEVKDEILRVLTTPGVITSAGQITITEIYERFENIYRGYSIERIYNEYQYSGSSIEELDKQFFMYPYAGLRFEFNITTKELCQKYV